MGRALRGVREKAVQRAAQEFLAKYANNQTLAAKAGRELGVPIKQQHFSDAKEGRKIGPHLGDVIAALYDTTIDGLVALFVRGARSVALRDVPGWARAKAKAMEAMGDRVEDWVWAAIDDVTVPASLKPADEQMVREIANFLSYWGRISQIRKRTRKPAAGDAP
jgi:hypothetical protein